MLNDDAEDGQILPVHPANSVIPEVVVPDENRPLRFSFRHLDLSHAKFQIAQCSVGYFRVLMERIKEYSGWTVADFRDQNNNEHRHVIDFLETSEPNGFTDAGIDEDQLAYNESWQFQLMQTENWRVHGILVDDTLYVIWLDPDHNLYPAGQNPD
jgi:hypothetical protein